MLLPTEKGKRVVAKSKFAIRFKQCRICENIFRFKTYWLVKYYYWGHKNSNNSNYKLKHHGNYSVCKKCAPTTDYLKPTWVKEDDKLLRNLNIEATKERRAAKIKETEKYIETVVDNLVNKGVIG